MLSAMTSGSRAVPPAGGGFEGRRARGLVLGAAFGLALLGPAALPLAAMASAGSSSTTLTAATVGRFGSVLGNSKGHSLYLLEKHGKPVACTSPACVSSWPPLLVAEGSRVTWGHGVKGHVGTVARGSRLQVTYNGWPVYTFAGDSGPRQANGEGLSNFGGTWYLLHAAATSMSSSPDR